MKTYAQNSLLDFLKNRLSGFNKINSVKGCGFLSLDPKFDQVFNSKLIDFFILKNGIVLSWITIIAYGCIREIR